MYSGGENVYPPPVGGGGQLSPGIGVGILGGGGDGGGGDGGGGLVV